MPTSSKRPISERSASRQSAITSRALHKSVKIFCLCVAAGQPWYGCDIKAFFVALNKDCEFALAFTKRFYHWINQRLDRKIVPETIVGRKDTPDFVTAPEKRFATRFYIPDGGFP